MMNFLSLLVTSCFLPTLFGAEEPTYSSYPSTVPPGHYHLRIQQQQQQQQVERGFGCPFMQTHEITRRRRLSFHVEGNGGDGGIPNKGGFQAVKRDIMKVLVDSKDYWPADFGNYGPFMIRLAWHCAGSYRRSDGRGGCDGGRIRFDPEINWPDNGNLDQALRLLAPIKKKYGSSLSWGDLIILTGTTAIEFMGGPNLGFCGGRIDDADGSASAPLGPSKVQQALAPCNSVNGNCTFPLGPTTIGLIYVNPAGPLGVPNRAGSAKDIKSSFGNMGFNESETVALIGGGHAFGKVHGACKVPPCGDGKGSNTFTSGFEGSWTTIPTKWSNQYFCNIFKYNWTLITGPGGQPQWEPRSDSYSQVPDIMMLTADLAFAVDHDYRPIAKLYCDNFDLFSKNFATIWYRLTSQDMGPRERCIGDMVPPAQYWQSALPRAPLRKPSYKRLTNQIYRYIRQNKDRIPQLIRLAYQCANTYRNSDHRGGCNGARIRFSPQSDWEINAGLDSVLHELDRYVKRGAISIADTIVLAGTLAMKKAGGPTIPFCGGRVDADGAGYADGDLKPRDWIKSNVVLVKDEFSLKGLTTKEGVALFARPTTRFPKLGGLFHILLNNFFEGPNSDGYFTSPGVHVSLTAEEYALYQDVELRKNMQQLYDHPDILETTLASGWLKMMNNDRYGGPTKNVCDGVSDLVKGGGSGGHRKPTKKRGNMKPKKDTNKRRNRKTKKPKKSRGPKKYKNSKRRNTRPRRENCRGICRRKYRKFLLRCGRHNKKTTIKDGRFSSKKNSRGGRGYRNIELSGGRHHQRRPRSRGGRSRGGGRHHHRRRRRRRRFRICKGNAKKTFRKCLRCQ